MWEDAAGELWLSPGRATIVPAADHNLEWHQGGHTSLDNTTPECVAHNRLKHTDGWKVRSDPTTGTVTWTSADGTRVITLPPPEP